MRAQREEATSCSDVEEHFPTEVRTYQLCQGAGCNFDSLRIEVVLYVALPVPAELERVAWSGRFGSICAAVRAHSAEVKAEALVRRDTTNVLQLRPISMSLPSA
jgi:hypothetical protein